MSPTPAHIGGAVISALAGTAAVGAVLSAAPIEAAALSALAIGGYVVTHMPVDHVNHDPRIGRMYKNAGFSPRKRTKFDDTISSTLKRVGNRLDDSFDGSQARKKPRITDSVEHESWLSHMIGDHRLGIQGELKRKHAGTPHEEGKRPKLGLPDDWMDAAESEGMHYTNLHEPASGQAPTTKRMKIELFEHKLHILRLQHKQNPFFSIETMSRKAAGIPMTRKVVHRYSSNLGTIQVPANANTGSVAVFANSLEFPYSAGATTENAMLFDQMAKIYDRYYISKCSIRVDYFNDSSSNGVVVGISMKDDETTLFTTGHYSELGGTTYKTLTPNEHSTLTATINPAKFFGSKTASSDSRLLVTSGNVDQNLGMAGDGSNARPTDSLSWHLWACAIDATNGAIIKVPCFITVEWEAIWSEPRVLPRSIAT